MGSTIISWNPSSASFFCGNLPPIHLSVKCVLHLMGSPRQGRVQLQHGTGGSFGLGKRMGAPLQHPSSPLCFKRGIGQTMINTNSTRKIGMFHGCPPNSMGNFWTQDDFEAANVGIFTGRHIRKWEDMKILSICNYKNGSANHQDWDVSHYTWGWNTMFMQRSIKDRE